MNTFSGLYMKKKKVLFLTADKKVKRKVARFLSKVDESLESCTFDVDEIGMQDDEGTGQGC